MKKRDHHPQVKMTFLLPASVPVLPAAHRLNARNSMAVVVALGPPTHWVTFTKDPY